MQNGEEDALPKVSYKCQHANYLVHHLLNYLVIMLTSSGMRRGSALWLGSFTSGLSTTQATIIATMLNSGGFPRLIFDKRHREIEKQKGRHQKH